MTLVVSRTSHDELRDTVVPVNTRWPIDEVLSAARHYADVSGRRVSIEYALIRDTINPGAPTSSLSGCAGTSTTRCA